jgi:Lon protease-like protein
MNDDVELSEEALADLPIFPLPRAVLLPGSLIALHIFEPRYRRMIERCLEGHRLLAIAQLDEARGPDPEGRPAVLPLGGVGAIRSAARLPDGRFNVVLEGLARVTLDDELPRTEPFRRVRARLRGDRAPADPARTAAVAASLRGLALRAATAREQDDGGLAEQLGEAMEPGRLADVVASALLEDARERQQVLELAAVDERVERVAGAVGALLLSAPARARTEGAPAGWGVRTGDA